MTATTSYSAPTSPAEPQISFRDGVTPADRENAERSVAALVTRSAEAVREERAEEAELAELTNTLERPLAALVEGDPHASRALQELRGRSLLQPDPLDTLTNPPYDAASVAPLGDVGLRSLGFVPPYDFSWAWHDQNGFPPFNQVLNRPTGRVGLDARSGAGITGGRPGFVNAHTGFGVFLPSPTTGQRFPHAVLNPGRFLVNMAAVGISSSATTEGGFELTVFEDGQFLTGASRKLWRTRISAGEEAHGGQGPMLFAGPELGFTMRAGHGYTFNAGIWVFSDRSTGIGDAAAQALLQGTITRMWVFG